MTQYGNAISLSSNKDADKSSNSTKLSAVYESVQRLQCINDIKDFVREGKIFSAAIDSIKIIPDSAKELSFDRLKNHYGKAVIHTAFAGGRPFIRSSLAQHIRNLEDYRGILPENISESERIKLHGVINLARLIDERCNLTEFPQFSRTLSFVWIGLSRGKMHFDIHNNFLCQLRGQKDVVLIPPEYTQSRGGQKYLDDFSLWNERYNKDQSKTPKQVFENIPHHIVSLNPGDCIFIPSGAYHAPFATTFDSISVNTFLIPQTNYRYRAHEMHEALPILLVNFIYQLSYLGFKLFNTPIRQGAFELI